MSRNNQDMSRIKTIERQDRNEKYDKSTCRLTQTYESVFLRMTTACYTEISFRTSATFSESSRCAEKQAVFRF